MAIKIGDVNDSAIPNSSLVSEGRTSSNFEVELEDRRLQAGEVATLQFNADLVDIEGIQFTLLHPGLEVLLIETSTFQAEHFGQFEEELTLSWNETTTQREAFALQVRAKKDLLLSDVLRINSARTAAEAYPLQGGETQGVELAFTNSDYALYQNQPNPFDGITQVAFVLPKAQLATLTISDARGKVLRVIQQEYSAGYQEVTLDAKTLAAGVLSYTLSTEDFTATKKMIILE